MSSSDEMNTEGKQIEHDLCYGCPHLPFTFGGVKSNEMYQSLKCTNKIGQLLRWPHPPNNTVLPSISVKRIIIHHRDNPICQLQNTCIFNSYWSTFTGISIISTHAHLLKCNNEALEEKKE